jgi:hypothetical protein
MAIKTDPNPTSNDGTRPLCGTAAPVASERQKR